MGGEHDLLTPPASPFLGVEMLPLSALASGDASLLLSFQSLAVHISFIKMIHHALKGVIGRKVKTRDFKKHLPKLNALFSEVPKDTSEPLIKFAIPQVVAECKDGSTVKVQLQITGRAECFVSHAWKQSLLELFETVLHYSETPGAPTYYLLDILSLERASKFKSALAHQAWADTFRSCIHGARRLLLVFSPWRDALPLKRAWCLYELYIAYSNKDCHVDIHMPPTQYEQFIRDVHEDPHRFFEELMNVNAENAEATIPEDKERILQDIRAGDKGGKGLDRFNALVKENIRQWFYGFCTRIADFVPNHHHRYSLAVLLSQHGRVDLAESILLHSCRETDARTEHTPLFRAQVLCQLGNIYFQKANHAAAADMYAKCDAILQEAIASNTGDPAELLRCRALYLCNVSNNMRLLDDLDGALQKMAESERLFNSGALAGLDENDIMFVLDGRARIFSQLGRHDDAVTEATRARDICAQRKDMPDGKQKLAMGRMLTGLGFAHLRRAAACTLDPTGAPSSAAISADYSCAVKCLREAEQIRRKVLGEEHQYVAGAYYNLGIAMVGLQQYDKALEYITWSVNLSKKLALDVRLERYQQTRKVLEAGIATMRNVEPYVFPHETLRFLTAQIPVLGVQISIGLLFKGAVI